MSKDGGMHASGRGGATPPDSARRAPLHGSTKRAIIAGLAKHNSWRATFDDATRDAGMEPPSPTASDGRDVRRAASLSDVLGSPLPPSTGVSADADEWVEKPGTAVNSHLHAVRILADYVAEGDSIDDLKLCTIERKWGGFMVRALFLSRTRAPPRRTAHARGACLHTHNTHRPARPALSFPRGGRRSKTTSPSTSLQSAPRWWAAQRFPAASLAPRRSTSRRYRRRKRRTPRRRIARARRWRFSLALSALGTCCE